MDDNAINNRLDNNTKKNSNSEVDLRLCEYLKRLFFQLSLDNFCLLIKLDVEQFFYLKQNTWKALFLYKKYFTLFLKHFFLYWELFSFSLAYTKKKSSRVCNFQAANGKKATNSAARESIIYLLFSFIHNVWWMTCTIERGVKKYICAALKSPGINLKVQKSDKISFEFYTTFNRVLLFNRKFF